INETINLTLSTPAPLGSKFGEHRTAVLTILDNDPVPTVAAADISVTEGNVGTVVATFTVALSSPSGRTVPVDYATANGTATAPDDYLPASGKLVFNPGEIAKQVRVTVNGDTFGEANETVFLNLSTTGTEATIFDNQAVLTILDDDGGLAGGTVAAT